MKKTKATFVTMILLFALLCAVTVWYGTNEIVYAETTGQDLEILCEEYTSDLTLYGSTDKNENFSLFMPNQILILNKP